MTSLLVLQPLPACQVIIANLSLNFILYCGTVPVPVGPDGVSATLPPSRPADNTGAIVGGVVAVVVIIAATIIAAITIIAIILRNRRAEFKPNQG